MKITKRQLKRIIREERQKLNEEIRSEEKTYWIAWELLEEAAEKLADRFYDGQLGDGAHDAKLRGEMMIYELLTKAAQLARKKQKGK